MMLIILHDNAGKIVAMGEADLNHQKGGTGVGILPEAGHCVVEIEKSGELQFKELKEIVNEYEVDIIAKRLVAKRPERYEASTP